MRLTLGPLYFNWPADVWRDFYFRIADEAPIDTVVVGETVCSKRAPFLADALPAVLERLSAAGKEALLGSLALVTLDRERRQIADLAANEAFLVEANDVTCLARLCGRAHAIGPLVNVYNEETAAFLVAGGARRICLPPELPRTSVATIVSALPPGTIEVFAFGRAPLAISARCYHARLHALSKDNCRFVCENDPDGLVVDTLDHQPFLAVNGVQTLSHACINLLSDAAALAADGVGSVRLSPQQCDMVAVARMFRDVLDGRCDAASAEAALSTLYPHVPFANGFLHGAAGKEWVCAQ